LNDGSYQISRDASGSVAYSPISFADEAKVRTQYNVTRIRNSAGALTTPTEPGWVYLVDYQYNWGSLRDILGSLNLELGEVVDNPQAATTKVVIREKGAPVTITPTPTATPTSTPSLQRYDLRSKPVTTVYEEIAPYLESVQTTFDSSGRMVLYGVTKTNVEFSHDILIWVGQSGNPTRTFNPGTTILAGTLVEYTYIGSAPTPTPTTLRYDLGAKLPDQVYSEIGFALGNLGSKSDAYNNRVIYGTTTVNIVFSHDTKYWLGASGNPLATFASGSQIPKGAYVEYTYVGPSVTPTPTPTPLPSAPPVIGMILQNYSNGNVIEVPKIMSNAAVPEQLNAKILGFAGDYASYLDSASNHLELKLYPFQTARHISLLMTRIALPDEVTQGEVFSVVYDFQTGREVTLNDAIKESDLDLVNAENKLLNALPGGISGNSMDTFKPVAFIKTTQGNVFFYQVIFKADSEGLIKKAIYTRFFDGSYEPYDRKELYLNPVRNDFLFIDPPLFFESN
jgi:hypothetical protein